MYNEYIPASLTEIPVRVDYTQKPNKARGCLVEMHIHDEIELVHVESGVIEIYIENKTYVATEGTTFFINSRIPHSTYAMVDGTSGILIQLRVEDFVDKKIHRFSKHLPRFANVTGKSIELFENEKQVMGCMQHMMQEYSEKQTAYEIYILSQIYSIIAFLYRNKLLVDAAEYYDVRALQKILPVLEYVDENYNKDLSLEVISHHFGLNPSYFSRMFKKAIGSAYTEYLNFVRVCKAEKLLKDTDMSILAVALEVGFSSVSYFNRVFKNTKNCTPTTYKKAMYQKMRKDA